MDQMIVRLLRWLVAWGALFDGLIGVVTFGMCRPGFQLVVAKHLARAKYYAEWYQ